MYCVLIARKNQKFGTNRYADQGYIKRVLYVFRCRIFSSLYAEFDLLYCDATTWKRFPQYRTFESGINWPRAGSPHKMPVIGTINLNLCCTPERVFDVNLLVNWDDAHVMLPQSTYQKAERSPHWLLIANGIVEGWSQGIIDNLSRLKQYRVRLSSFIQTDWRQSVGFNKCQEYDSIFPNSIFHITGHVLNVL